jgi:hypothetical protein
MDVLVNAFNAIVLLSIATLAGWAAIDERFETRIVMTGGLGMMCLGALVIGGWSGASALWPDKEWLDGDKLARAIAVLHSGLVVVVVSGVHRLLYPGRTPKRRSSDFAPLDELAQKRVMGGKQ